jgi:hypothetical protein
MFFSPRQEKTFLDHIDKVWTPFCFRIMSFCTSRVLKQVLIMRLPPPEQEQPSCIEEAEFAAASPSTELTGKNRMQYQITPTYRDSLKSHEKHAWT